MSRETEEVYIVEGLTCGHCREAVTDQVRAVSGVSGVELELDTGRLTVRGAGVEDGDVAIAVAEAGYEVRP